MTTLRTAAPTTVGTRVVFNSGNMFDLHNGDVGTVVGLPGDGSSYKIVMDNPRGRRLINLDGVECHWTTTGSDFDVVEVTETEGARIRITVSNAQGARVEVGDLGTLVRKDSEPYPGDPQTWLVKMDTPRGHAVQEDYDWYLSNRSFELVGADGPEPETLEAFKVKFITLAVQRAADNGGSHPEQVETILTEFARWEFLNPTTDLDAFKKKVVEFAFIGKKRYGWCPEPERFLRDLGLESLIPVAKTVKVEVMVTIMAEPGETRTATRTRAERAVKIDGESGYVDRSSII